VCALQDILGPRIEVISNRNVIIDGCDGIIDYDDERVSVKLGRIKADITGKKLRLKMLTENSAVIEGYVKNIEYIY